MKRRRRKIKIYIFLALVILSVGCFYCNCVLPNIMTYCQTYARQTVNSAVESCALLVLNDFSEEKFVIFDESEDVPLLHANSSAINKAALSIAVECNNILNNTKKQSFSVNLGSMSGIVFLNNIGPCINISFLPLTTTCYSYEISTAAVGINQVHYKIILNLITDVNLILPGKILREQIIARTVIADCIIVGKVPQYVLGSKVYDLIP